MTSTAAVRSDAEPGDTFGAFGERTAQSVDFARENSVVPIDQVLGTISSAVSHHSVMFVYNRARTSHGATQISDLSRDILPQTRTMFDLTLNVMEEVGGLSIAATFNAQKFASGFMETLTESYLRFLTQLSQEGIGQTLRNLLSLSTIGLGEVEAFANIPILDPPISGALLHEAFEARSMEAPLSWAIDCLANGQRTVVSYAELNKRARRLP
jgi:hypothetical protein